MPDALRINSDRMRAAFDELALIGATGDGGVNRPTFSEAHLAARKWFRNEIQRTGLEFRTDGAGNHSAVLPAANPVAATKTLMIGSHLDSVPFGGRFDGALGVMAALEILRTAKDNGLKLNVNLEAMDFTDEEGTLVSFLGSAALAGHLSKKELLAPRGGRGPLAEGMKRAGLTDDGMLSAARPKGSLAGYLELHIEQGYRLEKAKIDVGIVSAIVGIWSYRLSFLGRADHAGTTSMSERLDASQGACAFTVAARELVMKDNPNCVVNTGKMDFAPGAFNIIPARADMALEFRSPNDAEGERLNTAMLSLAKAQATRFGLELKTEFLGKHTPCLMNDKIQRAYASACDALGLTHVSLTSGAGHDGQSLADLCPVGMIFVPSVGGASHSAREFTKWEDCVNGANVLLSAALSLAGRA